MGYDKNLKLEPKQNALVVWAHFKEAMTVVLMCVSLTHVCAQHRTQNSENQLGLFLILIRGIWCREVRGLFLSQESKISLFHLWTSTAPNTNIEAHSLPFHWITWPQIQKDGNHYEQQQCAYFQKGVLGPYAASTMERLLWLYMFSDLPNTNLCW